jgi:hypothetical protein
MFAGRGRRAAATVSGPRPAEQDESLFERNCSLALARGSALCSCFLTVNLLLSKLVSAPRPFAPLPAPQICSPPSLARSSALPCSRAKYSGNAEDCLAGSRQPDALESLALAVPIRPLPVIVMTSALLSVRPGCRLASRLTLLIIARHLRCPCRHCSIEARLLRRSPSQF